MEIKPLTKAEPLWYPSVVAVSCSIQSAASDDEGNLKQHYLTSVGTQDALKIESAIYDERHNAIRVSCRDDSGSVSVYSVHLDAGAKEMKGRRTLTCKVLSLAVKKDRHKIRGELETTHGTRIPVARLKRENGVDMAVNTWIHSLPSSPELLTSSFDGVEPKLRERLIHSRDTSYWSAEFKHRVLLNEICGAITGWLQDRITIQQAIDWKLIPDYPVVELPYSLFHKYDTEEKLTFQGLYVPHSDTAHRLNMQTAARISRALGEPITVEELSQAAQHVALPYICIGSHVVYCLATATKTTKEDV